MQLSKIPTRRTGNEILKKLEQAKLIRLMQPAKGQKSAVYIMESLILVAEGKSKV